MTSQQKPTWIGLRLEDCIIDELVAEGSFSWVYAGNSINDGSRKAFKWAKHAEFVDRITEETPDRTQSKAFFTGGVRNIRPDAEKLLIWQTEKVNSVHEPSVVPIQKLVQKEGLVYTQMPFIAGPTLRRALVTGSVGIDFFIELATVLGKLASNPSFSYHGDIKPDNIILSKDGLKLIDPGYFGPADSAEGQFLSCAVTTTCYYPFLEPDDLMAVGICMWEAACKANPFLRNRTGTDAPGTSGGSAPGETSLATAGLTHITDTIKALVRRYDGVGHFYLQPLLTLKRPRELNPAVSGELELLLLKSLRLRLDPQGRIDVDDGFSSFHALVEALQQVKAAGVSQL